MLKLETMVRIFVRFVDSANRHVTWARDANIDQVLG